MTQNHNEIVGPDWGTYSYFYGDGELAQIQFDESAVSETTHSGYSSCIRVIFFLPIERVHQNGQPLSPDDLNSLLDHQRQLVDLLAEKNIRCRLVGSMIYRGVFDLVFQVETEDANLFTDTLSQWAGENSHFQHQVKELPGWSFFDEKIRPDPFQARQVWDRKIIKALIEAGSDPSQLHTMEHFIEGSPRMLRKIARKLKKHGFLNPQYPTKDTLLIESQSPLNIWEIWEKTGTIVELCNYYQSNYDGWGANVVSSE